MPASSFAILLIEDSRYYSTLVKKKIAGRLGATVHHAASYAETEALLRDHPDYFVAVVDLVLPDAADGQVVDLVLSHKIPSIILTSQFDAAQRARIISKKNVVDYLLKSESGAFDAITALIDRLMRNRQVKVLIVEDSASQRAKLKKLLRTQKYQVLEAEDGAQAMEVFANNPDIRLVITDYYMPVMDGFELVKELRKTCDKKSVAIIGMSSEGDEILSARFLKTGANDFLNKPYAVEELMARAALNVELLEMIETLNDLAVKDPLTTLYNRRYFFEKAHAEHQEAVRAGIPYALAMLDIDHFKKINDTFGHDAGDKVLQLLSRMLRDNTRGRDVVSRFGGEEFCILAPETDRHGAEMLFEKIRRRIEAATLEYDGAAVSFTASIGVACGSFDSLDQALKCCDDLLYAAKSQGRNRVLFA